MEESSRKVLEASCLGLHPCSITQRLCKLFPVWASISFPATCSWQRRVLESLGLTDLLANTYGADCVPNRHRGVRATTKRAQPTRSQASGGFSSATGSQSGRDAYAEEWVSHHPSVTEELSKPGRGLSLRRHGREATFEVDYDEEPGLKEINGCKVLGTVPGK